MKPIRKKGQKWPPKPTGNQRTKAIEKWNKPKIGQEKENLNGTGNASSCTVSLKIKIYYSVGWVIHNKGHRLCCFSNDTSVCNEERSGVRQRDTPRELREWDREMIRQKSRGCVACSCLLLLKMGQNLSPLHAIPNKIEKTYS